MNLLTGALTALQRRDEELLPILERWVTTNSYSGNVAGVNAVGAMMAHAFDLPGLSLTRTPGHDVGDHLFWKTPAWDVRPGERVLLIGHHDTVFPPDTFDLWERDGDRLRGPGVLDMKGGLAVIRTCLAALADAGALAQLPIGMISVGDEEIGSGDSRPLLERVAAGASAALVFEGGRAGDVIVTRRKGTGRFEVAVTGKAAHAGNQHADGVNAIVALAAFIAEVSTFTDYDKGVTVNVGLVSGGSSANTVPAHARCSIDFRFVDHADGEELVGACDHLARTIGAASGAHFTLKGGVRRPPLASSERSLALFRRYGAAARAAGLGSDECPLIGGGSDANTVSAIGVPAIDGLGPRGRGFHTHDEFIEVATLRQRTEALVRFFLE